MIRIFSLFYSGINQIMSASGPWFYAVKRGRVPGVYSSWAECEQQIKGFKNPSFRKFPNHSEAQKFVFENCANSLPTLNPSSSTINCDSPKLGISSTQKCLNCHNVTISNTTSGSEFENLKSTVQRMMVVVENLSANLEKVSSRVLKLEETALTATGSKRYFSTSANTTQEDIKEKRPKFDYDRENFTGKKFADTEGTHVYTDGGCFDNGRNGARAGIGVFWSESDPDNISERLPGRPTNNRAEIHAAVRAVQQAKRKGIKCLILHTDSQFLINGITKWIKGWKKNQWTKATGSPVINKEDFEVLDKELQNINVKWVYVRGHTGNPANESADRLAKQGAEKDL